MFTPSSLKNVLVKGAISSPKISLSSLKLANYYSTILKTMMISSETIVYPIKPRFRGYGAIGGNEGVAEVVAAGSKIKNMTIGDWVIPDTKAFGDIVIKNGKNSAVGQYTYFNKVIGELYKLGATLVIKEEDLHTNFSRELVESLGSPVRLALNCVSGKSTSGITRLFESI
ncbi:hypothetical protein H8356DRAFT_1073110 [Neocallimastix lanati (nom. inval.)]|nr:hypothetical protein H8356DRAFT_1073110 [Neocallimastix sp. JGI-2020a]